MTVVEVVVVVDVATSCGLDYVCLANLPPGTEPGDSTRDAVGLSLNLCLNAV